MSCGSILKVNQKCGEFLSEGQGEVRQITHEMELIVLSAPAWFFSAYADKFCVVFTSPFYYYAQFYLVLFFPLKMIFPF